MGAYRSRPADRVAEEAFDIAWEFLRQAVSEPLPARSFIADIIGRQIAKGDRNRIRVANRAISAYEASR
jgi:hypothetical protein